MSILFQTADVPFPNLPRRQTARWIKQVVANHSKKIGDINFVFCSDEEILRINTTYLNHDYYTDIITFDYSEGDKLSGDLFISLETVRSNSEKYKTSCDEELHRVIIHGILHLCGYDDKNAPQKKTMREQEDEALRLSASLRKTLCRA